MKWNKVLASGMIALLSVLAFSQVAFSPAEIAKKATPAVVLIEGATERVAKRGSGFIISADGKIVTALHLIKGLKSASVKLSNGSSFGSVVVLAVDEGKDLAIIKVDGTALPQIEMGDSDKISPGD